MKPVAERLVFRKPGDVLNLAFRAGDAPQAAFTAGTPLSLAITAKDEKDNPTAAVLWAAVVNSGSAPGAKDRLMPTHFLLAGEVKNPDDLEYADFLLTESPEEAGEALDLVLVTQGWRRFVEQSHPAGTPAMKLPPHPNAATTRLMVQNGQYATWSEPQAMREHRKLFETYAPLYEAAVKSVALAKVRDWKRRRPAKPQDKQAEAQAASTSEAASRTATEKAVKADVAREPVRQFRSGVWYGIAGFAALAFGCAAVSFLRPSGRLPLGFSTLGSLGLAAFLLVAASWSDDARATAAATTQEGEEFKKADRAESPAPAGSGRNRDSTPDLVVRLHRASCTRTEFNAGRDGPGLEPQAAGSRKRSATPSAGWHQPKADGVGLAVTGGGPGWGRWWWLRLFQGVHLKDVRPPFLYAQGVFGNRPDGKGGPSFGGSPPPPGPRARTGGRVAQVAPGSGGSRSRCPPRSAALPVEARAIAPGMSVLRPVGTGGWDRSSVPWSGHCRKEREAISWQPNRATEGPLPPRRSAEQTGRVEESDRPRDEVRQRPRHDALAPLCLSAYFVGLAGRKPQASDAGERGEVHAIGFAAGCSTPISPLVVREYAAPRPAPVQLAEADTPDTVLWQPVIVLPADGKTTLNFHLGTASGGYEVMIAGHTTNGRLGAIRGHINVRNRHRRPLRRWCPVYRPDRFRR